MRKLLPLALILLAGCGAPATPGVNLIDTYTTGTSWESASARQQRQAAEAAALAYVALDGGEAPAQVLAGRTELHPYVYYVNRGVAEFAHTSQGTLPASGELMYLVRLTPGAGQPYALAECVVDLRGQVWAMAMRPR